MTDTPAFAAVLATYQRRMAEEDAAFATLPGPDLLARRDDFLLAVGEDVARLLHAMVVGLSAKTIVELGTSYGYSTLFLADAARRTGGRLFTYELSSEKQDHARAQLADAGLADIVEWRQGDAVALLADQPGPVDFALIDLWKDLYVPCFDRLYERLAPRGVIVADNMLYPPQHHADAAAYRAAVRAKPDMQAALLPIGHGIDIACRIGPA